MSFDGEFVKDHKGTLGECLEASGNLGSKWFFYPFHFIVTNGGKVVDCPDLLLGQLFIGRYLRTVSKTFKDHSAMPEAQGMGYEDFVYFLNEKLLWGIHENEDAQEDV